MDRLTKQEIEKLRPRDGGVHTYHTSIFTDTLRQLCDLALQSLSLESVRSEARNAALEEAAKVCAKVASPEHWRPLSREAACIECAAAIRALGSALSPARVAEGGAAVSVSERSPTVGLKKALTVFFYEDDASAIAEADAHIKAIADGSLVAISTRSEVLFHQLRLHVAKDSTLLEKIEVFVVRDNKAIPIGLRSEDELHWPEGFLNTCWRQETEIQAARFQPAPESPAKEQPGEQNAR